MIKDYRVRALLDLDADELQRRTLDRLNGEELLTVHEHTAKAIRAERKRYADEFAQWLRMQAAYWLNEYPRVAEGLRIKAEAIEHGEGGTTP